MPSVGADLPGMLSLRSCIPGYGVAGFLGGSQLLGTYASIDGFLRMPIINALPTVHALPAVVHTRLRAFRHPQPDVIFLITGTLRRICRHSPFTAIYMLTPSKNMASVGGL